MSVIIQRFLSGYKYVEDMTDPNTRGWPLTNPLTLGTIMISYLFFCVRCGPKYMENRKPFELRNTIIVYNAIQVLLSVYLTVGGYFGGWHKDYNWTCQPVDYDPVTATTMNNVAWWYYFAKLTELLDTVFFVLRKKNNQVTFLHLYHHFSMPIFTYLGLKYYPNGHGTLFGVMNSFVHIIMYSYYLLAALGPKYQKYLWWKKHVTTIQLIQFALIFIHNFPPLFTSCTYPKFLNTILCLDSALFLYMFGKFYIKSYMKKPEKHVNGKSNGHINGKANGKSKVKKID